MPYAKISRPPAHANKNTGSSGDLAEYLEKENIGKDLNDHELFFNHTDNNIFVDEVVFAIDNNRKGLKDNETKFYEMSISFSQKEMAHINSITSNPAEKKAAIQGYVRNVMDDYANQFDRKVKGHQIEGKDLVYYAKIEQKRRYHPDDQSQKDTYTHNYYIRNKIREVKTDREKASLEKLYLRNKDHTVILPGNQKSGDNTHVHVIISRRDKSQSASLSPLANSRDSQNVLNGKKVKIGFDRDAFAEKIENNFDKTFNYERSLDQQFRYRQMIRGLQQGKAQFANLIKDPEKMAERMARSMINKMIRRGLETVLKSKGMGHLVKPLQKSLATNKSLLIDTASKSLGKEIAISIPAKATMKTLASSIPTPVGAVLKALTLAHSLIKSQTREKDIQIDRD